MESFYSSLKTERVVGEVYRSRDQARADVLDYIERFYNPRRLHSKIGYLNPMAFEARAGLVKGSVYGTGSSPMAVIERLTQLRIGLFHHDGAE